LIHDDKRPEDLNTHMEDHLADCTRYLLQTLRGVKTKEPLSGTAKLVAKLHRQKSFPEGLNTFYNNG